MEADKPFSCPVADCSMTFVNEDHLTVHKKKHELSLTLTPTPGFKNPFIDQTPTPTRFLSALESELFQEFQNDNPFDVTFRKANSLNAGSSSFAIPESSSLIASLPDSEVLNTPCITLPSEPQTPVAILRRDSVAKDEDKNTLLNGTCEESSDTLPFTPSNKQIVTELQQSENIPAVVSSTCEALSSIIQGGIQKQSAIRTSVVQTPVITSVRGHTNSSTKQNAIGVPTAVVVTSSPNGSIPTISSASQESIVSEQASQVEIQETNQATVQSVSVTPMVQLLIRLPDGQTMPVQIPVVASTSKPIQTVPNIVPKIAKTTSLAKMKLKEILSLGHASGRGHKKNVTSEKIHPRPHIRVLPAQDYDDLGFSVSPPLSPNHVSRPGASGRKRRDTDDDPDERRKKSLERNRAAATRCRQKRKQWIQALEKKADELANTNVHLQHEVSMLRNEVTHLKTMLLAHKDCPVTQQQKASGYAIFEKDSMTTVHIIASTPQDIQSTTGEHVMMQSPLDVQLMEMEVNSSQSGSSDASICSDTSEMSCRER